MRKEMSPKIDLEVGKSRPILRRHCIDNFGWSGDLMSSPLS